MWVGEVIKWSQDSMFTKFGFELDPVIIIGSFLVRKTLTLDKVNIVVNRLSTPLQRPLANGLVMSLGMI